MSGSFGYPGGIPSYHSDHEIYEESKPYDDTATFYLNEFNERQKKKMEEYQIQPSLSPILYMQEV